MASNDSHHTHDCAERIRERLPRRLQELREAVRLSMYALWQKCGVSRDTISRVEASGAIASGGIFSGVPHSPMHPTFYENPNPSRTAS